MAFSGCKRLVNITLPDSVYDIDKYAIFGCDKLVVSAVKGSEGAKYAKRNKFGLNIIP